MLMESCAVFGFKGVMCFRTGSVVRRKACLLRAAAVPPAEASLGRSVKDPGPGRVAQWLGVICTQRSPVRLLTLSHRMTSRGCARGSPSSTICPSSITTSEVGAGLWARWCA